MDIGGYWWRAESFFLQKKVLQSFYFEGYLIDWMSKEKVVGRAFLDTPLQLKYPNPSA